MECEPELQALLRPESHSIFIRKLFNHLISERMRPEMYNIKTIAH